ncbi:hypothetical protein JG687_00001984 [Phytophthora cactorum]|uniref:Uncharacterized protein n=2 Tax=Phytophthora TaxID=4783 RepID=A0A8J5M997_9STRA|nr:hypothetical protein PC116_g8769 [Phytophthora cactorum]KAG6971491.1 hypothetical protein JG687_00001984 [Phytophthora cactorum]KAG6976055.1 hypothetical protein JG688_00001774 [Phytophthora aleatoria]
MEIGSNDSPEVKALQDGQLSIANEICHTELSLQDLLEEHVSALGSNNVFLLIRVVQPLGKRPFWYQRRRLCCTVVQKSW